MRKIVVVAAMMLVAAAAVAPAQAKPDAPPKPAAEVALPDAVLGIAGDRISGVITGIGRDGILRITSPHLERETGVRLAGVAQATFTPAAPETDPHTLLLANDDRLAGKVIAMTPAEITLESAVTGRLVVKRSFVQEIRFVAGPIKSAGPPRADFSSGDMGSFQPVEGRPGLIAAEYAQEKPITVVMDFADVDSTFAVALFAADMRQPRRNSIHLEWTGDGVIVNASSPNSSMIANLDGIWRDGRLRNMRLTYDPGSKQVILTVNGRKMWDSPCAGAPENGRFIVIAVQQPIPVKSIRVLEGVVLQDDAVTPAVEEKGETRDTIILANGDRLTTDAATIEEGSLKAKDEELGGLAIPLDRLGSLVFRKSEVKLPPPNPKAVKAETARSSVTLEAVELDDKSAIGRSAVLDMTFRLNRATLKSLQFAPIRPLAPPVAKPAKPGPEGPADASRRSSPSEPDAIPAVVASEHSERGDLSEGIRPVRQHRRPRRVGMTTPPPESRPKEALAPDKEAPA